METEKQFAQFIEEWLLGIGVAPEVTHELKMLILFAAMLFLAALVWYIGQQFLNRVVNRLAKRTKNNFDDYLVEKGFFRKTGHIIPIMVLNALVPLVFTDYPDWKPGLDRITDSLFIIFLLRAIDAFINATGRFISQTEKYKDKPVASFSQLAKIVVWLVGSVLLGGILLGKTPLVMFGTLGAASAVLLFVFKDAILGFVASIQLSINDMIRIGDWVSVPKYNADGDIIEINLTTVKVQNWDRTISTVPTYSFVSDGVTNWRGMEESGGRRIKRRVHLKISTVKLCNAEMLERFRKIELVKPYLEQRSAQIEAYNGERKVDSKASIVNGRRMTNLGVFRNYILAYLRNNSLINKEMTCMVRQMESTDRGVPLEVYCFSSIKTWVEYESIQSDLFDHILAVAPSFDLDVFEAPSGSDLRSIQLTTKNHTPLDETKPRN
jgi:miniconductance mechanosensitive channel